MHQLPDAASCYFELLQPMFFPVRGGLHDILSVWAFDPNLFVVDPTGRVVVSRGYLEEGRLWSWLDAHLESGAIRLLSADAVSRRMMPHAHPGARSG